MNDNLYFQLVMSLNKPFFKDKKFICTVCHHMTHSFQNQFCITSIYLYGLNIMKKNVKLKTHIHQKLLKDRTYSETIDAQSPYTRSGMLAHLKIFGIYNDTNNSYRF